MSYYPRQPGLSQALLPQNNLGQSAVQYNAVSPVQGGGLTPHQQQGLAQQVAPAQVQQMMQQQANAIYGQVQGMVQQHTSQIISGLQAQIDLLRSKNDQLAKNVDVQFPREFKAGLVEYPNLNPFPIPRVQEMLTGSQAAYGLDGTTVIASYSTESGVPFYATHVRFDLMKTVNGGANVFVLNTWLPLSSTRLQYYVPGTDFYPGRDFFFEIESSSKNLLWQSGEIPSSQADGEDRRGFKLPCEVKVAQGETITVRATPTIAAPPDAGDAWRLFCTLYGYKMVADDQLISIPTARAVNQAVNHSNIVPNDPIGVLVSNPGYQNLVVGP
jgi:hypothetical protein